MMCTSSTNLCVLLYHTMYVQYFDHLLYPTTWNEMQHRHFAIWSLTHSKFIAMSLPAQVIKLICTQNVSHFKLYFHADCPLCIFITNLENIGAFILSVDLLIYLFISIISILLYTSEYHGLRSVQQYRHIHHNKVWIYAFQYNSLARGHVWPGWIHAV